MTLQSFFGQLQVTFGHWNLVRPLRNLVPKRLEITHLFRFGKLTKT